MTSERLTVERIAERDAETLKHIELAEEEIREALKSMPNSTSSVFMASDPRDLSQALRLCQTVRSFAAETQAAKARTGEG